MFHCDKCDEAVLRLRLHPVKAPARYTFNHEVLIDVIETKGAAGERYSFLSIVDNGTLPHQRHGSSWRRNPVVSQVRCQIFSELVASRTVCITETCGELGEETDSNRNLVLSSQSERSSDGDRYTLSEWWERRHFEAAVGRNDRWLVGHQAGGVGPAAQTPRSHAGQD